MNVYAVTSFNGGMNDVVDPSLLNSNTAAALLNANVTSGKLVPFRRLVRLTTGTKPADFGHYGGADRSAVKWYERNYWSYNTATTGPYYGGDVENYLGIPYPAYTGAGANVTVAADTPASGETGISGDFKYCVTFVNANGWEGAPGSNTDYETGVTLTSQTGVVTVTWSSSIVAKAKIYRTIDHGADFYCIGEITTSGSAFRDTVPDTDAQLMNPLSTIEYFPPPDKGKFLCEAGGVFFLAVGSLLYFSVHGNPHAWPTTQFVAIDDLIAGIVPEFQGVLVFTAGSVFRIVGAENPDTVTKTYLPGNHGCINYRTIAVLNNAPVWLSRSGIALWDGNSITVPSHRVLDTDFTGIKGAAADNDRYFLFLTEGTVVYDLRNEGIFYKLGISCDYAWRDSTGGYFYWQSGSVISLFNSGKNLTMEYRSPLIGGNEPALKIFRELIMSNTEECRVFVFVDGVEKVQVVAPPGRTRMKLPFSATGYSLSLVVRTAGDFNGFTVLYD